MLGVAVVWLGALAAAMPLGQHATLHWVQRPGAEACIAERQLVEAVVSRLGDDAAHASAPVTIEGDIEALPDHGGWKATLRTTDATGEPLGQRELREPSASCRALDDKLVLVIALIVDPELLARPEPAHVAPPIAAAAVERAPAAELAILRAMPPPAWRLGATVSALASRGMLPGVGLGAMISVSFAPPHAWPFELAATLWPHDRGDAAPGGAMFLLATAGASLCPTLGAASLCVGAQAGQLRASGFGYDRTQTEREAILDAIAEARFTWQLTPAALVRLGVGVWVPVSRPRFVFSQAGMDVPVYQPAPAAIVTQVAVGTRF